MLYKDVLGCNKLYNLDIFLFTNYKKQRIVFDES